ncbi:peptidylprolyl isomerase [Laspinema olomoucense]|uniref:peptidylprolyl isomerase n=1 Tax=Laspinema olomoucense TaxID=3231600 RepID=UPI0021BA74F9|nr:peptidylprolyl isomerase [Laspinema sp. D3d]MCT7973619.1 peptidylprolyl isomerase [Laspinema sp. D3d]
MVKWLVVIIKNKLRETIPSLTAEQLKQKIDSNEQSFETLARKHSIAQEANANGMMGPVRVSTLPDGIKTARENATPGEAIAPVEFEGTYGLFRVEEILPEPELNDSLKQTIRNPLFEKGLQDKLTKMTLTLEMD